MAKKRKLRSSEPETAKAPEPQPQQPPAQPDPTPEDEEEPQLHGDEHEDGDQTQSEQIQDNELHGRQDMAVDDTKEGEQEQEQEAQQGDGGGEEEEDEEEEEEDEEQQQDETLNVPTNGAVSGDGAQSEGNEGDEDNEEEEDDEVDDEPVETLLEPFSKEQLLSLVKQALNKYPDFVESVRELADADPAHRKIFVHGLGWDTTAETLTSVFGRYGEIEDCKAVTDRVSGKSKGYAFILFKHRSGARKALKQPQKKIGNRTTSCQLASAGPVPAPPPVTPPVSEYTQRKIFVSNVSAEIEPQKLLEYFRQFGEIEEGPLGLDKHTGKPKGFALFVYKSIEGARKALEEPHKVFEGHTLHCQKAIDGPKPNKPYHHHHNQPPHYHPRKEKSKYSSGGTGPGHLMAPSAPAVGFNPGVAGVAAPALNPALGQALTALLTSQGAGLGLGNLLGGLGGAPVNQAGPPVGYGNQAGGSYGNQPGMQGGYQNPQMGQSSAGRPHPGAGAPYMGH
ncbi:UBP1-associated protein 2A [Ziziphus jujuba]|uniref:UBP1-associated protein 2A n=2 Tax=Ziziphus jujuba TaxID=326968 RepID=A0A6P3Z7T5_ZIZJJ|nr:UBP1-associated protein 2A [Ziziphus jujuba]XP_015873340.2 UBP1-associated protein 2A [Ziziphus jujuba]XP_015873341.2 UBP1-associated protein 2A [Ziziphus jujuba]XP_015873342.2 UBP1-associated protein 2A [Ziziphus jujuba]XP_024926289.2 UBP1-associated protein 2A [Ziziphus jujuba]XP_024926290.2 UBP1-associated protein 2A [Ziziphus jujuba]XP_024926291.2 UBP1-associated protein 2A-like [Ziziphus jujuba var. spinosa]XP_048323863.1 UBP1-associated protein 2A-like [Ziziphus jujuba var. spinosa]